MFCVDFLGRVVSIVAVACLLGVADARADETAEQPAPTLQRLSEETQALYEHVRPGIIRIQLPPTYVPQHGSENVIDKWKDRLDPEVLKRLRQEQARPSDGAGLAVDPGAAPTTQPTTQPDPSVLVAPVYPRLAVNQRPDGGIELTPFSGAALPYDGQIPSIELRVIGLLIDDRGHVLVPLYIEPAAIGEEPLRCSTGAGERTMVKFVGSDRQTNLTVFRLADTVGRPVKITGGRPADGALVMVLSPGGETGRLTIWTGGQHDRGVVVTMDGGVAGFARYGQFLNGAYAEPVVEQLIKHGRVRRATLGVLVEETETPAGVRAMRIERVVSGSPAEKVGLRADDYILAMGERPVGDLPSFAAAIAARDGETELRILRGEREFSVTVVLKQK